MSAAAESQASAFLPDEIVSNILTRLPVKSICRCKCVCKTWLSIISSQPFVDSHSARSKSQPNLLFTFCKDKNRYIFIADPAPDQQKGTSLVLRHSTTMPVKYPPSGWMIRPGDSQSVGGLMFSVCSQDLIRIANPSTNKRAAFSRAFPPNYSSSSPHAETYGYVSLGFDPVQGKHKLLQSISVVFVRSDEVEVERTEHRVVTLGDDTNCWRYVKDGPIINRGKQPNQEICVNGVIYFDAAVKWASGGIEGWEQCIVAFDVRTESFQAVKFSTKGRFWYSPYPWRYVEFDGKVAIVDYPLSNRDCCYDHEDCEHALEVWVLEDFQNQVWSLKFAALPPLPMKMDDPFHPKYRLVGTTLDGELIFVLLEKGDNLYCRTIHEVTVGNGLPLSVLFFDMKMGDFRSSEVFLPEGFSLTGEVTIMAMGHVEKLLSIADEEKLKAVVRPEEEIEAQIKEMRLENEEWSKAILMKFGYRFRIGQGLGQDEYSLENLHGEEKLEAVKKMRRQNEMWMKIYEANAAFLAGVRTEPVWKLVDNENDVDGGNKE